MVNAHARSTARGLLLWLLACLSIALTAMTLTLVTFEAPIDTPLPWSGIMIMDCTSSP